MFSTPTTTLKRMKESVRVAFGFVTPQMLLSVGVILTKSERESVTMTT